MLQKNTTMQFVRHCIMSRMEKQHSSRTYPKDLSPPYRAWDALATCMYTNHKNWARYEKQ